MSTATDTRPLLYTEVSGTNCTIDGHRGVVTGLVYAGGISRRAVAAFVKIDNDGLMSGPMLRVELGATVGERGAWHEVDSWRVISRDDFDQMEGLVALRTELGWRD